MICIFKLWSGETVVADFISREVINQRTNKSVYSVKFPIVISDNYTDGDAKPWVAGVVANDKVEFPIACDAVMLMVENIGIDPVLREVYPSLVNSVYRQSRHEES